VTLAEAPRARHAIPTRTSTHRAPSAVGFQFIYVFFTYDAFQHPNALAQSKNRPLSTLKRSPSRPQRRAASGPSPKPSRFPTITQSPRTALVPLWPPLAPLAYTLWLSSWLPTARGTPRTPKRLGLTLLATKRSLPCCRPNSMLLRTHPALWVRPWESCAVSWTVGDTS
jgi:hypothetical protein